VRGIVGGVDPNPASASLTRDCGRDPTIARRDERENLPREIATPITPTHVLDPARPGERRQALGERRAHDRHDGPGSEQPVDLALRDGAATEHNALPVGELHD